MIKVYSNPKCSKSQEVIKILKEKGVKFKVVDYIKNGLNELEVRLIVKVLNCNVQDIVRTGEPEFAKWLMESGISGVIKDEDFINLLIKYPVCLQRPIVMHKNKAVIARPALLIEKLNF